MSEREILTGLMTETVKSMLADESDTITIEVDVDLEVDGGTIFSKGQSLTIVQKYPERKVASS